MGSTGTSVVVYFVLYLVFFSVMVFGGLSIESNKMVGRLYRYWISLFKKPVLRMLPTIFFFFSIIQSFISIDSSFLSKDYLSLSYPQIYEWVFNFFLAFELISFALILILKPKESDFFNANEYCEEKDKYYAKYHFFSNIFRKPICQNNVVLYIIYKTMIIAKGIVYIFVAFRCVSDFMSLVAKNSKTVPTGLEMVVTIVNHFERNDISTVAFLVIVTIQSILELVEMFVLYKLGQTRASFELRAETIKGKVNKDKKKATEKNNKGKKSKKQ